MIARVYLFSLSACLLAITSTRVAATGEFCHGWTDLRKNRREGFYCPEKDDRKSAIICCGRCEYRYCCSDGTARLDQGTCSDSDPDRKLPNKADVVANDFSTGDYPVYVPFLIVGSAFLALLLFGGSACYLYNRHAVAFATTTTTTTTTAMTTTAMTTTACGSSTSLCPHGDRILGDQPRCRGDSCHRPPCYRGNEPGNSEHPAIESAAAGGKRPPAQPPPTCVHCSGQQHSQLMPSPANQHASQHTNQHTSQHANQNTVQHANQHAGQQANQHANQYANQYANHNYPHPPTLFIAQSSQRTDQQLSSTQHFNTHPQNSAHSKVSSSAQYATMPHAGSAQDRPLPMPMPLPKLPISPQQLPPGALIPASLLRGYILPSQPTPAAQRQYRIPSPPPSVTLTHHPMM